MHKLPCFCLCLLAKLEMYSTLREVPEDPFGHLPTENERILSGWTDVALERFCETIAS